jgi:hypothetical protein
MEEVHYYKNATEINRMRLRIAVTGSLRVVKPKGACKARKSMPIN